jgi:hypothetical protein
MNNPKSSKKNIIYIIIVVAVLATIYFYYNGRNPSTSSETLSVETSREEEVIINRIMSLLGQINSLNIDASLFASPSFQTLKDYSVQIPPVEVGRDNPFAPLPGMPKVPARRQ